MTGLTRWSAEGRLVARRGGFRPVVVVVMFGLVEALRHVTGTDETCPYDPYHPHRAGPVREKRLSPSSWAPPGLVADGARPAKEMSLPQPRKRLPPGYQHRVTLDLSRNARLLIGLNLAGLPAFVLFGWLFLRLAAWLRPGQSATITAAGLLIALLGTLLMLVIHELIHGLGFWLFTGERPTFGFKGLYAYAGAPECYLPRNQHIIVGLAPLVVITLAGLPLLSQVPDGLVAALMLVLALNAAGAVGDLYVAGWLLTQPSTTLVRDTGDAFSLFVPAEADQ